MDANTTFTISPGMHVYSSDHKSIGTVEHVEPDLLHSVEGTLKESGRAAATEVHGVGDQIAGRAQQLGGMARHDQTTQQHGSEQFKQGRKEAAAGSEHSPQAVHEVDIDRAGMHYFRVKHGGFLGFGAEEFYIPYSAVQSVNGNDVILNVASNAIEAQNWHTKPTGLHQGLT